MRAAVCQRIDRPAGCFRHKAIAVLAVMTFCCFSLAAVPSSAEDSAEEDRFRVGGALRFNYRYMDWDDEDYARINKAQGGEFLLDTYRINVDGSFQSIALSLEYRFYSGYHMLHHGFLNYDLDSNTSFRIGVLQVPFGTQPYASHNWFFSLAYYLGLEDDYDAGIQVTRLFGPWELKAAFFKESEGNYTGDSDNSSRYSYDIVDESFFGVQSNNREAHQFNLKISRVVPFGDGGSIELAASGQYGLLFNSTLDSLRRHDTGHILYGGPTYPWGSHFAGGLHVNGSYGRLNVITSATYVEHNPRTVALEAISATGDGLLAPDYGDSLVVFGAYDFPYSVASKGVLLTFGPAWSVPVDFGPVTNLQFYNDFGVFLKGKRTYEDSYHNVTGVLVTAGRVYTYIDIAHGKNNPWLGQYSGLGTGIPGAEWKMRFNANMGYYF